MSTVTEFATELNPPPARPAVISLKFVGSADDRRIDEPDELIGCLQAIFEAAYRLMNDTGGDLEPNERETLFGLITSGRILATQLEGRVRVDGPQS